MNVFSYAAAVAVPVYLYCAFRSIKLDPRANVNRIAAALNSLFALWAFASIFCYVPLPLDEAAFWYRSFAFCWSSFASLLLHFSLRAAGRKPPASRAALAVQWTILYAPAVFFSIATNAFMVKRFEFRGGFWFPVFDDGRWLAAYSVYYISYCLIALFVLLRASLRATGSVERKRLRVIFASVAAALLGGFVTDTVFLSRGVDFPNMAILWILIWATGMLAAMSRYSFLSPFPASEASRIVDAMADVFLYLDESGSVVWANSSALRLSGAGRLAVLKGRRFDALFSAEDEDSARFSAVLSGRASEHTAFAQYGEGRTPLFARLSALRAVDGAGGFILAGRDMTEERRRMTAESRLEETGLLLEKFVSHSLDGIVVTDSDGSVVTWNDAIETITGISGDEARTMRIWDMIDALARGDEPSRAHTSFTAAALKSAFGSETPGWEKQSRELPIRDRRGRDRVVQISSFFIPASRGAAFAAIARDVTDERRAAADTVERIRRLDHAQKMEAIGTLSGGLAHDFNNALGGIVGAVSLMRLNIGDGTYARAEDALPELEIVTAAADRASKTVRRLLSLTRKRAPEAASVRLGDAARRVVDVAARSVDSSVRVLFEEPAAEASVLGDAGQIEQLALNLVINAAHSMTIMRRPGEKRGGTVAVSLARTVPSPELLAVNPAAESKTYWVLSVKDEGVGISNEIRSKIFDPFFTTKAPDAGSGLGLAMVDSIARQHGGFVELESALGAGSVFRVYLPLLDLPNEAETPAAAPLSKGSGLVLVAEDEESLRAAESAMLKALGYRSMKAADGAEAIALFKSAPASFAAALIDLNMPEVSGDQVFAELKAARPDFPIVLASGYAPDDTADLIARAGSSAFLQKPFTVESLGQALARAMADGREG